MERIIIINIYVFVCVNSPFDTLETEILLAKLETFAEEMQLFQQVAKRYDFMLNQPSIITTSYIKRYNNRSVMNKILLNWKTIS